jgi:hypothetical protein
MIHTTKTVATFTRPFTLPGLDRSYPPGAYEVITDEEQLDLSFSAFRRISTRIALSAGAVTEYWPVAPTDLAAALANDVLVEPGMHDKVAGNR